MVGVCFSSSRIEPISGNKILRRMTMENLDTIKLLQECDAGTKMAVASIDEILEKVTDTQMKHLLSESKAHHEKIDYEIHLLLAKQKGQEKEPNSIAKGMSWIKTNMKMSMDNSDATVADLITDGCNMGVKSLYKYLNQYKAADQKAQDICIQLASIEETLGKDLRKYL